MFPTAPATGKNGKVSITTGDGNLLSLEAMTLQASYTLRGEVLANQVYLLGTGKTLINMRSAKEPHVYIDGIIDGLEITPGTANDTIDVSAGTIMVSGVETSISAQTGVAVARTVTAGESCWLSIGVDKVSKVVAAVAGAVVSGTATALLDTWVDGGTAGARPTVPVDNLLVGLIQSTSAPAAIILSSAIKYYDRESSDIDVEVLPNIGGAKITTALIKCHTGSLGRVLNFTGYYMDDVISEIGTAKSWSLNPASNQVSEQIFSRTVSITETGAWSFSFSQLATDTKAKDNILKRQGYAGFRLTYPNGGYWQGVGTFTPTFSCAPGALSAIEISGSLLDDPVFV